MWKKFCDNDDLNDLLCEENYRLGVCSWHFDDTDIVTNGGRARLAYNGIVPHVRPPPPRTVEEGGEGLKMDPNVIYSKYYQ
jgi:hypothetical protein